LIEEDVVRSITTTLNISLDGVIQAPGRPDEDTRGGFDRGGWAVPYNDEVMAQRMGQGMAASGAMLFGRRTYEDFYGYWPRQTDNPFTPYLNQARKYVVSTTPPSRSPGRTRSCFRAIRRSASPTSRPSLDPTWQSLAARSW